MDPPEAGEPDGASGASPGLLPGLEGRPRFDHRVDPKPLAGPVAGEGLLPGPEADRLHRRPAPPRRHLPDAQPEESSASRPVRDRVPTLRPVADGPLREIGRASCRERV